jgi:hypothetical protein
MSDEQDIRDRLIRVEQDMKNNKEIFHVFKTDEFGNLKSDVQVMRKELNEKIDDLINSVSTINITIAKWIGGFTVVIFFVELMAKKLF